LLAAKDTLPITILLLKIAADIAGIYILYRLTSENVCLKLLIINTILSKYIKLPCCGILYLLLNQLKRCIAA
jgi:hypothetical protein